MQQKIHFRTILLALLILFILSSNQANCQNEPNKVQNVLRVNLLNPGIEFETPIFKHATISGNVGVGYGGSYQNTTGAAANGWQVLVAPFLDVEFKHLYNIEKRIRKGRSIEYNSGNYWGLRSLTRGKAISSNFNRYKDIDYAMGPVWGIQRSYGGFHILFDMGMSYYFDGSGRDGFMPSFQLNIGYDVLKF